MLIDNLLIDMLILAIMLCLLRSKVGYFGSGMLVTRAPSSVSWTIKPLCAASCCCCYWGFCLLEAVIHNGTEA
jgi:hypothetical protein